VPEGRAVVLDLAAEKAPHWRESQSYGGRPFIWCAKPN
jgi:hypothetical protein